MSLYIPLDFIDLFKHNLHKDGRDENIVQVIGSEMIY